LFERKSALQAQTLEAVLEEGSLAVHAWSRGEQPIDSLESQVVHPDGVRVRIHEADAQPGSLPRPAGVVAEQILLGSLILGW